MKPLNVVALNAVDDSVTATSSAIDTRSCVSLSAQATFSVSSAAGTLKLQASNDPVSNGAFSSSFTPTNWTDIANATATVTAGASVLITLTTCVYNWVRVVYTPTGGTGAITCNVKGIEF